MAAVVGSIQKAGDKPFFLEGGGFLVVVMAGVWCVCCGVWGGCGMMGSPTQISHTALL